MMASSRPFCRFFRNLWQFHQLLVREQLGRHLCNRDRNRGIYQICHRYICCSIRGSSSRWVSGEGNQHCMRLFSSDLSCIRIRNRIRGCDWRGGLEQLEQCIRQLEQGIWQPCMLVGKRIGRLVGSMCCRDRVVVCIHIVALASIARNRNRNRQIILRTRYQSMTSYCRRGLIRMSCLPIRSSRGRGSVSGVPGSMGGLALRRRGLGPGL